MLIVDDAAGGFFVDSRCVLGNDGRGACAGENKQKITKIYYVERAG
jgi:hypothetical protein